MLEHRLCSCVRPHCVVPCLGAASPTVPLPRSPHSAAEPRATDEQLGGTALTTRLVCSLWPCRPVLLHRAHSSQRAPRALLSALLSPHSRTAAMYHFLNCLALAFAPHVIAYKATKLYGHTARRARRWWLTRRHRELRCCIRAAALGSCALLI